MISPLHATENSNIIREAMEERNPRESAILNLLSSLTPIFYLCET